MTEIRKNLTSYTSNTVYDTHITNILLKMLVMKFPFHSIVHEDFNQKVEFLHSWRHLAWIKTTTSKDIFFYYVKVGIQYRYFFMVSKLKELWKIQKLFF